MSGVAGALTDILFVHDESDVKVWKNHLVESGRATEAQKKGEWNMAEFRDHVRRYLPLIPDGINEKEDAKRVSEQTKVCDAITTLYQSFSTKTDEHGKNCFTSDTLKHVNALVAAVRDSHLGDPSNVQLYYIVNRDSATPSYYTCRGSSQLENFWKQAEQCFSGPNTSPEVADATMLQFVFRYNIDRAIERCAMNGGKRLPTYDIDLIASMNSLAQRLGISQPFPDVPYPGPGAPVTKMGCELLREDHEAWNAFNALLSSGGIGEHVRAEWETEAEKNYLTKGTGIPRATGPVATEAEKALYRAMEPVYRDNLVKWDSVRFESMASEWNRLVLASLLAEKHEIAFRGNTYSTDKMTLKDKDDFQSAAKGAYAAMKTTLAKGATKRDRQSFQNSVAGTRPKPISGPEASTMPQCDKQGESVMLQVSVALVPLRETPGVRSWATGMADEAESDTSFKKGKSTDGCPDCRSMSKHLGTCATYNAIRRTAGESKSALRRATAAWIRGGKQIVPSTNARKRENNATSGISTVGAGAAIAAAACLTVKKRKKGDNFSKTGTKRTSKLNETQAGDNGEQPAAKAGLTLGVLDAMVARVISAMRTAPTQADAASRPKSYTSTAARTQLRRVQYEHEWVDDDGNCLLYGAMSLEKCEDQNERQRLVALWRLQLHGHVIQNKADYIIFVMNSVRKGQEARGEELFSENTDGKELAWAYWCAHISNSSYWMSDFEISVSDVLGIITVVGFWSSVLGAIEIRRYLPEGG